MMRSVLRLTRFPVLAERTLTDVGAPIFSRLDITSRNVCTSSRCDKEVRTKFEKMRVGRTSKYDEMLEGETSLTATSTKQTNLFPDADTPNRLFNGVPYTQLHIVNIKSTPNNTIMTVTDSGGRVISLHSAGVEGFKNAKKGTNIAAQQAAITFGNRILEYGVNTVRLRVQGLGAGRMVSV
ncbi:hypothetical protein DMN91_002321 [Ooceraea biroi]|uniref:30S ribosomal protein S11 n=1 Tax=Ooceraea biroi TaxID=2015173 RepID=A0A3L8E190_OOCBI|nr:hypothetical protein DMN91_002321 [Ooceraea biroi]